MSTLTSYKGLQIVSPDPTGDGGLALNNNFKALSTTLETAAPGPTNNSGEGYSVGSRWIDMTTGIEWVCTNATGSATWTSLLPTLDEVATAGASTTNALAVGGLTSTGTTSLDSGAITTDGSGNLMFTAGGKLSTAGASNGLEFGENTYGDTIISGLNVSGINFWDGSDYGAINWSVGFTINGEGYPFAVINGPTSLDSGAITTDGSGDLKAAGLVVAGNGYADGLLYIDTTAGLSRIGDWNGDNNGYCITIDDGGDHAGSITITGRSGSVEISNLYLQLDQWMVLTPNASPPPSPTMGTLYCDTSGNLKFYNGTGWKTVTLT